MILLLNFKTREIGCMIPSIQNKTKIKLELVSLIGLSFSFFSFWILETFSPLVSSNYQILFFSQFFYIFTLWNFHLRVYKLVWPYVAPWPGTGALGFPLIFSGCFDMAVFGIFLSLNLALQTRLYVASQLEVMEFWEFYFIQHLHMVVLSWVQALYFCTWHGCGK